MKSTIQFPWLFSSSWKNNLQLVKKLFLLASWLLFQANIFAQCNNLTCKTDTIPVYLATNCQVILDPLNFIQTPPTDCPGSKFALAFDALNNPIGIINNTYINQILNITVFDINSGKKCDSHILVKDTMAPILVCQSDITVHCNLSISPADLPTPIAVDNCGGFLSLVNTDVIINNPCPLLDMVFRTWKATDASGNTKTCLSTITRTGSCIAPTTQASNITFSSVGSNQMTVNWTNGNGGSRIVKINKSNSFTNPVNGVSPTANSAYSGSGEQVIYNNSGSSITVTGLLPNTTYWFRVYEANCSGASILYNATLATKNPNSQATQASSCIAVSILSQPVPNQSVIVNGTATFSIVAGGTNDYTYQWYKGTTPLTGTGKTSPTYTIEKASLNDNGKYYCVVKNCSGTKSVKSNESNLIITDECIPVSISSQPQSQTKSVNDNAYFLLSAGGSQLLNYQWYEKLTNGQINKKNGAIDPFYMTPKLTLSDNGKKYQCIVTNCNGKKTAQSDFATLIVTSSPSFITINNIIENNSAFPNPEPLWKGYTSEPSPIIKLCADGSISTQIIFENNTGLPPSNIRFRIPNNPNNNTSEYFGKIGGYIVDVGANIITVSITHPDYLPWTWKPFRPDIIEIFDSANPEFPIYTIKTEVYRAPVVMVHGYIGSPDAFEPLYTKLYNSGLYINSLINNPVDYHLNATRSFEDNKKVVPKTINACIQKLRTNKISTGKVDIVCHSMGGLLSRNYLQSDEYKFDIHKLITINTPHWGSQGAKFITDIFNCQAKAAIIAMKTYIYLFINPVTSIFDGAAIDMAIGSNAMQKLNLINKSLERVVPSHSIITYKEPSSGVEWIDVITTAVLASNPLLCCGPLGTCTLPQFFDKLFDGDTNDLVVASASQSGGLSGNAISKFGDQFHIGSAKNNDVMQNVQDLLNEPPSSDKFEHTGYKYELLNYKLNQFGNKSVNTTIKDESLKIIYPLKEQTFYPGENIAVKISSTNGINKIQMMGMSDDNIYIKDTLLSKGTIIYQVPTDAFEKVKILVLGYDTLSGFVGYDTVSINIKLKSKVDSISTYNDTIFLEVNNSKTVQLKAHFSDGLTQNISYSKDVKYQVGDSRIAEINNLNQIKGNKIGATNLIANYFGKAKRLTIITFPEDTIVNLITSVPFVSSSNNNSKNDNPLKIFPNPNNGEFTLQIETLEGEPIQIKVYNQFGQEVYSSFEYSNNINYTKLISLKESSSGIYFVNLFTSSHNFISKILLTK